MLSSLGGYVQLNSLEGELLLACLGGYLVLNSVGDELGMVTSVERPPPRTSL